MAAAVTEVIWSYLQMQGEGRELVVTSPSDRDHMFASRHAVMSGQLNASCVFDYE